MSEFLHACVQVSLAFAVGALAGIVFGLIRYAVKRLMGSPQ